jgi:hypothetical protein
VFEQGKRQLRNRTSYCCLGVLCELFRREKGGRWELSKFITPGGTSNALSLPSDVADWAETSCNPSIDGVCISDYNDGAEAVGNKVHSFSEIADLISKNL